MQYVVAGMRQEVQGALRSRPMVNIAGGEQQLSTSLYRGQLLIFARRHLSARAYLYTGRLYICRACSN